MRIKDDCFKVEQKQVVKSALIDLVNQPTDRQARPCPGCRFAVGNNHSTTSTAHCSAKCPVVSQQMSSDPKRHPIEPGIVPLVYAFYTMRLMMPCWSCEGHIDHEGNIFKTPKLWFYATNEFYAKLVAQYVSTLRGELKIAHHWSVRLLPFSQSMFTTTYSLEPQDITPDNTDLSSLQNDIHVIAKDFHREMLKLARHYIQRANKNSLKKDQQSR
ncbi:MAG: hypothetical protein MJK04_07735 [Psychrosphaera sp.]|nr:hypothetical protein [Psychrosphaera sp.]